MLSSKPTLLVIDDEAINIQVVGEILGDDYEVLFALNGPEGLKQAREAAPDLILLDVRMPGMDGYQVCTQLQADPRTSAIPIVFVTALDSTVEEIQGIEAGAIDYLTKPLRPQVVKARIRSHLLLRSRLMQQSRPVEQEMPDPAATAPGDAQDITPRQRQILEWIQAGKTNDEIAQIIGSSKANVKYHISRVMEKLGTHNRAQLIARAVSLRLIKVGK